MNLNEEIFRENMTDENLAEINSLFITKFINNLSIDFIREFKDKIDWKGIEYIDKDNEKFLREFKKEIIALIDGNYGRLK